MRPVKVNDTFAEGHRHLANLLKEHSAPPEGYVPQHDKAHVKMPIVGHRNGYPICYLNHRR